MSEKKFHPFFILARTGLILAWAMGLVVPHGKVQSASMLYVNGVSGNDTNLCTYSHPCATITRAVAVAASGDTISISSHVYEENLVIQKNLELVGQSAKNTIVDGQLAGPTISIMGSPGNEPQVYLNTLTVTNGMVGVRVEDAQVNLEEVIVSSNESDYGGEGGGIKCLSGSVTTVDTTVTNNQANFGAGVIVNSDCVLSMANSTIYLNQGIHGAGLYVNGSASLTNVTISLNQATQVPQLPHAGGIFVNAGGSATLNHCTIAKNQSLTSNDGWQIWAGGTVYLKNTIVQGGSQPDQSNCKSGTNIVSLGYNLSSDATCNLVGSGDLPDADAQLYALAANGGSTYTHGLPSTSPVVDAASPPDPDTPTYDQRGMAYCDGDFDGIVQGDIGAFEYQPLKIWLPYTAR